MSLRRDRRGREGHPQLQYQPLPALRHLHGRLPRAHRFVQGLQAYPALDTAAIVGKKIDPSVRFVSMRCLGGMNLVWVADALSKGIDGMLLLGCKYGENYQCHFVKGSELANTRFSKVSETLNRLQLESGRVELMQVAINEYEKLPEMINGFVEKVKEFGPNPFKSM
jgi:quinone-modifying oxidoreductase subunit QmoB